MATKQSSSRLGQYFLLAVAFDVKEYFYLKTQKLAKYALHISPLSLCTFRTHQHQPRLRFNHCLFVCFRLPFDYDIVV
jgi:hypothetical protein